MKIDNKIDKFFGDNASFAGYILILAGVAIAVSFNISGIILIIFGLFMSFTYTGAEIDIENRKYRFYNKLFGLFKIGRFKDLSIFRGLKVERFSGSYNTYRRSNRKLSNLFNDYRIVLQGESQGEKNYVFKHESFKKVKEEAARLSKLLNLPLIDKV